MQREEKLKALHEEFVRLSGELKRTNDFSERSRILEEMTRSAKEYSQVVSQWLDEIKQPRATFKPN